MKINNLEFRKSTYLGDEPEHPSYDIVLWYPNDYYGKEDKYIKEGDWYRDPQFNFRIYKDCFKHPECCMTIACFKPDSEGFYEVQFIEDRPLDKEVNWKEFYKLLNYGNQKLNYQSKHDDDEIYN